jgi:methylated-DNA-[protein]-cysteine S-methyltransferase
MIRLKYLFSYSTSLGSIAIAESDSSIVGVFFEIPPLEKYSFSETPLLKMASAQIYDYLKGHRKEFTFPFKASGTMFQMAVWNSLKDIPYGETCSYKDIALLIGSPNASRAVGMACNRNPLPILVPCHRVIGSDGSLTGYAGGIEAKKALLSLESSNRYCL